MSMVDNTMDEQPTDEEMALWLLALQGKAGPAESTQAAAISGKMARDAVLFEFERINLVSADRGASPEAVRAYKEFVASAVRGHDIPPSKRPISPWLQWAPPLAVAFAGLFSVMLSSAPPMAEISEQHVAKAEPAPVKRGADRRIASVEGNPIIYFRSRDPVVDASLLSGKLRKLGLQPKTEYHGRYVMVTFYLPTNLVDALSKDLTHLGIGQVSQGTVLVKISRQ
jgi:hypothetical protein